MLNRQVHQLLRRTQPGWRHRLRIAQHLAGHPVLAVAAVIIAAEHSKGQRIRTGKHVEEGLLLDGVARQCSDISVRDQQLAPLVESHSADPIPSRLDYATMSAGEALDHTLRLT